MKKNISIFLIVAMIFLSGCGMTVTKVESTTESNSTESETAAPTTVADITTTEATTESALSTTATTAKTTAKTTSTTQKKTEKSTSAKTTEQSKNKTVTCTIEIDARTILNNIDNLSSEKKDFLPADGYILKEKTVTVDEGSSVFDVLIKVCKQNTCPSKCSYCLKSGIQLDYNDNNSFGSAYIRGIHQLYEKDCGTRSGWMYKVNDVFPSYGMNKYTVKNGDEIKIIYTCDLGDDIGNSY